MGSWVGVLFGVRDTPSLILLGAGATRGASFVRPDSERPPPPLDVDFFSVLHDSHAGRRSDARLLTDHVYATYGTLGHGPHPRLETVFSNLALAATYYDNFRLSNEPHPRPRPSRLLDCIRDVIPELLGEAIQDHRCEFHSALARHITAQDVIISLNYDCLMDRALQEDCHAGFDPAQGAYGVPVGDAAGWSSTTSSDSATRDTALLLKLHGSLNWANTDVPLQLRSEPYVRAARGTIVPPLANKDLAAEPFRSIWQTARSQLHRVRLAVVVGYSLPETDGLIRALLQYDLAQLETVIVVDPDVETAGRVVAGLTASKYRHVYRQQPDVLNAPSFETFVDWL
jgi:hypothetical protein